MDGTYAMSVVICDQCSVHIKCDARVEDCPRKCSDTCFNLDYHHKKIHKSWAFLESMRADAAEGKDNDGEVVIEDFSWSSSSDSSSFIGTVLDNIFD